MKLYTRAGDDGSTGLFGGSRVSKNDPRVRAYGAVDEANSAVGLAAAAAELPAEVALALPGIMSDLFDVGAELATPPEAAKKLDYRFVSRIDAARVIELERFIDDATAAVPPLQAFVLPSGTDAAARMHFARTVVRRAEREIVAFAKVRAPRARRSKARAKTKRTPKVRDDVITYMNRLSDLLFAWARLCNARAARADVPWQPRP